jgi:hypothetical protein
VWGVSGASKEKLWGDAWRIVVRKHALFLLYRAITTLTQRRQWGAWIGRAQRRYASAVSLDRFLGLADDYVTMN